MPFKKFYLKSANLATMLASIKLDSLFAEKRHKGKFKQNQISFTIKLEDTDVEVIQKKIKKLNMEQLEQVGVPRKCSHSSATH